MKRALGAAFLVWCVVASRAHASDEVARLLRDLLSGGSAAQAATERLRFLGPDRAGPPLRALLNGDSVPARIAASAALALVRDPGSTASLVEHLSDEDWEVRRNCANALGVLKARSAGKGLVKALDGDPQTRVRKAAALALGEVGGAAGSLGRAAKADRELEVRLAALDALARSMDPSANPAVRPLLRDASGFVRFAAARALAWTGDASARAFLSSELSAPEAESRQRAITVLSDVPRSWAGDLLARALDTEDADSADAAAQALARRGDRRGIGHLARVEAEGGARGTKAGAALDGLGVALEERQQALGRGR